MPKISRKSVFIRTDSYDKRFEFDIHYNSNNGFYAIIPEEMKSKYVLLPEEAKGTHKTKLFFPKKHGPVYTITCADTESACENQMVVLLKLMLSLSVEKKPVILISFATRSGSSSSNGFKYNEEHNLLNMSLGITYAIKSSVGNESKYYTPKGSHITMPYRASDVVIIDDTPESRQFLDNLYDAFRVLSVKLSNFTFNAETLQNFISSNQKLLN